MTLDLTPDLDDFDSAPLADVKVDDGSYLRGMWNGYGFRSGQMLPYERPEDRLARDTVTAHGMVQAFVNAFARDGRYEVAFSAGIGTAGTDMNARQVLITPAPIADPTLTPAEAGLILTGLAVHEISHPRYGRRTAVAVKTYFPDNGTADRLSNLLDDIRIERRFIADYPGYAGVFEPTLDYVGRAGGTHRRQSLGNPVNLAIAATRYPAFSDWTPETAVERDWWNSWADRWSPEDAPARHVNAIREALEHVAQARQAAKASEPKAEPKPQPKAEGPRDDAQATEPGPMGADEGSDDDEQDSASQVASGTASEDESKDEQPTAPESKTDTELNDETKDADSDEVRHDNSCAGSASVEKAASQNGASKYDISSLKGHAQSIVDSTRNQEDDGHGNAVDVARSVRGLFHGGVRYGPSELASRYIRNAILRSRTGHAAVTSFAKRGRLDQKGISRIAFGDTRLFEQRRAPSPGKYVIWVMIDCSSSMGSAEVARAAQVAHAIASATQGTPSVRMAVWGWSNPFRASSADAGVARVWQTGQPTEEIFKISGLRQRGTPDAQCISWAARAILKDAKTEETPVIIFASDGNGDNRMNQRVDEARKLGIIVKSVSFGNGLGARSQLDRFGKGNFIPWAGSIAATARPLADLIARITSGK